MRRRPPGCGAASPSPALQGGRRWWAEELGANVVRLSGVLSWREFVIHRAGAAIWI